MKRFCNCNLTWGLTALMPSKQGEIPLSPWTPIWQTVIRSFAPSAARIKSVAAYTRSLFLFVPFLLLPLTASAKLRVVTTTTDLAALTRAVGGDLVQAESLCRGDQDPHYLEAKPSYVVKLSRADLLIEVGLQLEVGWLPVLLTQSRNPKIQRGVTGHLDASEGLAILEIPTGKIDRSMGDVHPEGNPHYWLNPENGLIMAQRIAERLARLDPPNAQHYLDNATAFSSRLKINTARWKQQVASLRGKKIVTHHKSFSYLIGWIGLEGAGQIEPKPGIPPSPSHLVKLISLIEKEKIPLILIENFVEPKSAQEIARKTGVSLLIVPASVGGTSEVRSYEELFDFILQQLKERL